MNMISLGILVSIAITIAIGWYTGKYVRGKSENFFVAGRKLTIPLVAIALMAQAVDGNATLANTGLGVDFGFWAGVTLPIGLAISLFILGKFFAGKLNSMKLLTLGDFFRRKYGRRIELIACFFMLLSFGVLMAGNLAATGFLMMLFFPLKYQTIVILISIAVLIYSIRGGIISDTLSDIFQVGVLSLGVVFGVAFLLFKYGLGIFTSSAFAQGVSLTQLTAIPEGALINWATIFALAFGNLLAIDFTARVFSAKSPEAAKKGCYYGGWGTLLLGVPFSLFCLYALHLGIAPVAGVPMFLTFSEQVFPLMVSVLLVSGIIAVSLSTIDGAMLSMGNIIARNIFSVRYEEDTKGDSSYLEKILLYFSRISMLPVAAAGMLLALLLPYPGILLTVAFDIMFAGCLVPFVAAFVQENPSRRAAYAAIIVGSVVRLGFALLTPTSFGVENTAFYIENALFTIDWDGTGTFIAPLMSLIAFLVVSKTKPGKSSLFHKVTGGVFREQGRVI